MEKSELATRTAVASLLYAAGAIAGPVGPFLVPAVKELSSPQMKRLTDYLTRWQGDSIARAVRALEETERLIAQDAAKFLDSVMATPPLLAHFARALSAVYESEVDAKVAAMARSMATAAQEPSAIQEEHLFVDAIRRLEAAHINFLAEARRATADDPANELSVSEVTEAAGLSPASADPVVRTLHSAGCINLDIPQQDFALIMNAPVSDQAVNVTNFGIAVLSRLGIQLR